MADKAKPAHPSYPKQISLPRGKRAVIRLMEPADREALLKFARALPEDDLLFLRTDITDKATVKEWVDNIKRGTTVTLLAEVDKKIAAYASVHLDSARWTRRLGEIRLMTGTAYRGIGLGRRLAAEIFTLARGLGLKKLTAQMTLDQAAARAAFDHLGFQVEAVLRDWVEDRNGAPRDLLVMTYDLTGFSDRVVA